MRAWRQQIHHSIISAIEEFESKRLKHVPNTEQKQKADGVKAEERERARRSKGRHLSMMIDDDDIMVMMLFTERRVGHRFWNQAVAYRFSANLLCFILSNSKSHFFRSQVYQSIVPVRGALRFEGEDNYENGVSVHCWKIHVPCVQDVHQLPCCHEYLCLSYSRSWETMVTYKIKALHSDLSCSWSWKTMYIHSTRSCQTSNSHDLFYPFVPSLPFSSYI